VLRPGDRPIARVEIFHAFADEDGAIVQRDLPLELQMRQRKGGAGEQSISEPLEIVGHDRTFAVRRQSGGGFLAGRPAENIEAQIVAHDGGQQLVVGAMSVFAGRRPAEVGRSIDRHGGTHKGIDCRGLLENLRDVSAADKHADAEIFILDGYRAAALVTSLGHRCGVILPRSGCSAYRASLKIAS
jgi:hypothetical protein